MIKTRTMYDLYNMYLLLNIQNLQKKSADQKLLIETYLKELTKIRPFIENYVDYHALLNGKVDQLPEEYQDVITSYKFNNIIVKNYHKLYNVLLSYEEQIKRFNAQKVKVTVYKTVITRFNQAMVNDCANTGKEFTNLYFGRLKVIYRENTSNAINWGASNKKKEEILARGGKLFVKEEEEQAIAAGLPYNAEKWIVKGYDHGLLSWRFLVSDKVREVTNQQLYNYKFIPARGNYGSVNVLKNIYKNPNHDYSIYDSI